MAPLVKGFWNGLYHVQVLRNKPTLEPFFNFLGSQMDHVAARGLSYLSSCLHNACLPKSRSVTLDILGRQVCCYLIKRYVL